MAVKQSLVKRKTKRKVENMSVNEVREIEDNLKFELENNPKYSLKVNPTGELNLNEVEVEFIEHMIQYKNIKFVAGVLMNLDFQEALEIYKRYEVQEEIKRINLAMYARRFSSKMADLDALGGYLTTALTDDNVAVADRLSGKDKLIAVRLLIDLNKIKSEAIEHPEIIDVMAIENDIKNLKVDDIKALIENDTDNDKLLNKKNEIISEIDKDGLLTPEEVAYLRTQSLDELKKLNKDIKKGLEKNEEIQDKN